MKNSKSPDVSNKKAGYYALIFIVVIMLFSFVSLTFLNSGAAFHFNCINGTLLGISGPVPPMLCGGCLEFCDANIEVRDENNTLVCESFGRTIGAIQTPVRIDVRCTGLEKYLNKTISLNYDINSSYGFFKNRINLTVEWGVYEQER